MTIAPLGPQAFAVDSVGASFAVVFAIVWGLAALHALASIGPGKRLRFWSYFLPAAAGGVAVAFAQDAIAFYFTFALMALPSWGLISLTRRKEAERSGRIYLAVTVFSEMLLLGALMLTARAADSLLLAEMRAAIAGSPYSGLILALILGSAALKIGTLGFSGILPLTYTYTPTAPAAALAGASVKVGALALLRLLPLGEGSFEPWGQALIALGLATAFVSAAIGVFTTVPNAVLGYSSASQMGLILAAVGAGLAGDAGIATGAVVAYSVHHGFAKASLFFGEGVAAQLEGRWRIVALAALGLPALALAGAPFTSGFVAKYALYDALYQVGGDFSATARALLPWAAVGTSALMARFLLLIALRASPAEKHAPDRIPPVRRPLLWTAVVWTASLALVAAATWVWPASWAHDAIEHALDLGSLWSAVWPSLVAAGAALTLLAIGRAGFRGLVPPGDWMLSIDPVMKRIGMHEEAAAPRAETTRDVPSRSPAVPALGVETTLTIWMVAGSVFMVIAVVLVLLASL